MPRRHLRAGALAVVLMMLPAVAPADEVVASGSSGQLGRAISREAHRLAIDRGTAARAREDASKSGRWVSRHPVLTGAMIGAAAGAGTGYAVSDPGCGQASKTCTPVSDAVPFVAMIGAGAGAIVGGIVHAIRK